ncbi:carbohydrate ABC transporter permease [Peloplasma aerotolerans]|uniref:Carbohydrate ABC transporter permease n=1 Tax=Peloplasma aerotolerans TaxID=3044389 RepID=A0AAW6U8K9_9MOLU|nr:carbohydrate ABC transporter permease [Mariniplasma sp. M4Ah]MDI6452433.1 carbohydrate ABC transporter permease [Mariniplasma sp. M4Ah]MDR4969237.1 carbohydrate ABC transporter permease [Acholeplasmataceae bacterium]
MNSTLVKDFKTYLRSRKTKRLNRSRVMDMLLFIALAGFGLFSAWPLIYVASNAFKPLDEIFRFPPQLIVRNPTFQNFSDLFRILNDSWVPLSRYFFNTLFYTVAGTAGHVMLSSMAAYPLAKYEFPGKKFLFAIVVLSLMFAVEVTAVPNYITISAIGLINTPFALILPAFSASLGLYLLKQFMEQVPMALIESARMDGASEMTILFKVVIPQVKPAILTLIIFSFQGLWAAVGGSFIYSERWKTMTDAISSIVAGGVARAGVAGAASLLMISVPIIVFIITQSNVVETMSTSGIKE